MQERGTGSPASWQALEEQGLLHYAIVRSADLFFRFGEKHAKSFSSEIRFAQAHKSNLQAGQQQ
jgi:hypothetical protein